MKMPEPTMPPITTMVASNRPRRRTSFGFGASACMVEALGIATVYHRCGESVTVARQCYGNKPCETGSFCHFPSAICHSLLSRDVLVLRALGVLHPLIEPGHR